MTPDRWAVVLAGGVGSRFWPLSTPARPKQLLPLATNTPLIRDALDRMAPLVPAERTLILTSASLRDAIARVAPEVPAANYLIEPRAAGTAAALAWAAREIRDRSGPEAVMMSVHADWAVGDPAGFLAALDRAATAASERHGLVTVGVVPSRPDPGFGYIHPGDVIDGDLRRVQRFVEKPDRETAARMCADGFLWNSGIFVWRVGDFLDEVRGHTPEVSPWLEAASAEEFFNGVKSVSVDVGVLERSSRVLVLPGDFQWDDVGTWGALHRVRGHDAEGNAANGDLHVRDARGNVVHTEGATVVLYGVQDLVVVVRDGLVLVTTRERSSDLKTLVDNLPPTIRDIE